MAEKRRRDRISEQLRAEIAALVESALDDPRVDPVTVTSVDLSGDMRNARVYVSGLGGEVNRKATLEGLSSARGFLRRHLSQRLPHLKRIPELTFSYDESVERGMRIEEILSHIHDEDEARDAPAADDGTGKP